MEGDVPNKKCFFKPAISGVVLENRERRKRSGGVNIAQQPFERLWVCQKFIHSQARRRFKHYAPCDPPRIKGQKSPTLL